MPAITTITDEARIVAANLYGTVAGGGTPTVRLGVTGLSRAGKTVFITALVHNLVHGGRLPLFDAYQPGPARRGAAQAAARRRGAALRLRGACARPGRASASGRNRRGGSASFASSSNTSRRAIVKRTARARKAQSRHRRLSRRVAARPRAPQEELCRMVGGGARAVARAASRRRCRRNGIAALAGVDADGAGGRGARRARLAEAFTRYLRAARADEHALSMLPPGPLPDARRSRRLARPHLRAARRRARRQSRRRARSPR